MRFIVAALALLLLSAICAFAVQSHPTQWTFSTIDDPRGETVLTGINNLGKVVGYVQTGGVRAVTAEGPGYAGWIDISFPGAANSYALGLSNTRMQVGHADDGMGSSFGYVRGAGAYSSYGTPITWLYDVNDILCGGHNCGGGGGAPTDPLIVGMTADPTSGIATAFQVDWITKAVTTFAPPGAVSAVATGINGKGHVCGYFIDASGAVSSWVYENGTYYEFGFPGAQSTTARAINWQDDIVGKYVDASGAAHGFVMFFHTSWPPITIDFPGGSSTIVRGINNHDELVGSYVDAGGATHGFLAIPQNCPGCHIGA